MYYCELLVVRSNPRQFIMHNSIPVFIIYGSWSEWPAGLGSWAVYVHVHMELTGETHTAKMNINNMLNYMGPT